MNPKEKAKELIIRHYAFVSGWTTTSKPEEIETAIYEGENMKVGRAKQCALITVDEILNDGKMKFAGAGIDDAAYQYWVEVKQQVSIFGKEYGCL